MTTNNHPAHGPVSLDRLHQISEILSKASAQSDGGNLGYAMADAVKVIDGAIAAFGAEPVLYAAEETLAYARMGELHLKCLSQPMGSAVIPLYRNAQSAPASVPAAMEMDDDFDSAFEHGKAVGWNACRAAMLQSGNSPVTPDCWIKCSERMPEDEQEVLTRNRMGHCFVSFFDEHSGLFFDRVDVAAACCIEHILVTHWMPLPAAPQQEAE
ncbi:DUF551 domain-containing protein [Citrobacter freundii]|uniref:DUF551 domain-containing protein n=1 Tax=Citrobacter freundii TaxID=546 RepID=UPI00397B5FA2